MHAWDGTRENEKCWSAVGLAGYYEHGNERTWMSEMGHDWKTAMGPDEKFWTENGNDSRSRFAAWRKGRWKHPYVHCVQLPLQPEHVILTLHE